jgi:hypothetical protein
MELRLCKQHNTMTWHEKDNLVGWYCLKCLIELENGPISNL